MRQYANVPIKKEKKTMIKDAEQSHDLPEGQ